MIRTFAALEFLIKSRLIGTPAEDFAKRIRWLLGANQRRRHPELWEFYLEELRLPLVLNKLLSENSRGVDVGSHLGSFLNLLTKHAPKGRHLAFEPITSKNVWLKTRFPEARVLPFAVSDKNGTATFEENLTRSGYSSLFHTERSSNQTRSYDVQTCRLDDVIGAERVDLIKLDVEGGELASLQGARKTISAWCPSIIFECGSEYFLNEAKLSRRELYDFIVDELHYDIFCFGDFLFEKGKMSFDEFRKCGLYPFRAFNFIALPSNAGSTTQHL